MNKIIKSNKKKYKKTLKKFGGNPLKKKKKKKNRTCKKGGASVAPDSAITQASIINILEQLASIQETILVLNQDSKDYKKRIEDLKSEYGKRFDLILSAWRRFEDTITPFIEQTEQNTQEINDIYKLKTAIANLLTESK